MVEEKLASPDERLIEEVNSGVFYLQQDVLHRFLPLLSDQNPQGEYLLPDILHHALHASASVEAVVARDAEALVGINDLVQLAAAERSFQRRRAEQLMRDGVRIVDPNRIDIRGDVRIAANTLIDVNVVIEAP